MGYPMPGDRDEEEFRRDQRVQLAAHAMMDPAVTVPTGSFTDLLRRVGMSADPEPKMASAEMVGETITAEHHVSRSGSKAKTLMALYGGVVFGGLGVLLQLLFLPVRLPTVPVVGVVVSLLVFGIACVLLTEAVKPSLTTRSGRPYGFVRYAALKLEDIPAAVIDAFTEAAMTVRLQDASITAMDKYRLIRRAVKVAWVGVGLLAATIVTAPLFFLGWLG